MWKGHTRHTLIEQISKGQSLKAVWQRHTCQTLIERTSKGQSLQAVWQGNVRQTLIEQTSKGQSLKAVWQRHTFQTPDRNTVQRSKSEGCLATSHLPNSDRSPVQRSKSEGCLATSHPPNSDWTRIRRSKSAGCLAMSRPPNSDWIRGLVMQSCVLHSSLKLSNGVLCNLPCFSESSLQPHTRWFALRQNSYLRFALVAAVVGKHQEYGNPKSATIFCLVSDRSFLRCICTHLPRLYHHQPASHTQRNRQIEDYPIFLVAQRHLNLIIAPSGSLA